jgi:tetratricopeptide (TPR) repeat protein
MDFDPNNKVIQLCMQGMAMEEKGNLEEAGRLFFQAWRDAANDFEKFTSAYYLARHQKSSAEKLKWLETALDLALKINSIPTQGSLPALYSNIAECYADLGDPAKAKKNRELADSSRENPLDKGPFYHGTRANLKVGDLLTAGRDSNYKSEFTMNHIYFTALLNGAGLAAALAKGEVPERVYIVEPTGPFESDPNVTDKRFPGNPTRSYRSHAPLKIVGEVTEWLRQSPEDIKRWREKLANSNGEIIN